MMEEVGAFLLKYWLTLTIGALGVLATWFTHVRAQRKKILVFNCALTHLVDHYTQKIANLEILYEGNPIPNLGIARFLFYNAGSESIQNEDFKTADPFRLEVPRTHKAEMETGKILQAEILEKSSTGFLVELYISTDKTGCELNLNYLEPKQGFIIQLVHTSPLTQLILPNGLIRGVELRNRIGTKVITQSDQAYSGRFAAGFFMVLVLIGFVFNTFFDFEFAIIIWAISIISVLLAIVGYVVRTLSGEYHVSPLKLEPFK